MLAPAQSRQDRSERAGSDSPRWDRRSGRPWPRVAFGGACSAAAPASQPWARRSNVTPIGLIETARRRRSTRSACGPRLHRGAALGDRPLQPARRLPRLLRPGAPLDLGHPRRLGAVPQRQRRRPPHPPLRPGILLAFASGTTALVTDDDELEQTLAVPMGVGIGSPSTRRRCCSTCATSTGPVRDCSVFSSASAPQRSSASRSSPCGCCDAVRRSCSTKPTPSIPPSPK